MSDTDPRSLREELEIRVVALLTGEISEADADELEKILSVDEELTAYRDRMAELIGDVHTAREEISPKHPVMRFSDERREALLGAIESTQPNEVEQETERKVDWKRRLLGLAALLTVSFIIFSMSIPAFQKVRSSAPREYAMSESNFEVPSDEAKDGYGEFGDKMLGDVPATGRLFRSDDLSLVSEPSESAKTVEYFGLQTEIPEEVIEGTPAPIMLKSRRSMTKEDTGAIAGGGMSADFGVHDVARADGYVDRDEDDSLKEWDEASRIRANSSEIVMNDFLSFEGRDSAEHAGEGDASYAIDQVEVSWLFDAAPKTEELQQSLYANASTRAQPVEARAQMVAGSVVESSESSWGTVSGEWRSESDFYKAPSVPELAASPPVSVQAPAPLSDLAIASNKPTSGSDSVRFGREDLDIGGALGYGVALAKRPAKVQRSAGGSQVATSTASSGPVDPFAAPSSSATFDESVPVDAFASNADSENISRNYAATPPNSTKKAKASDTWSGRTRKELLAEVDQSWERPKVFDAESEGQSRVMASPAYFPPTTQQRMQQIVIPQLKFNELPLSRVVETLGELSLEYDSERRGIAMAYLPVDGHDPKVNISLRNLSLDRILEFVTEQVNYSYDVTGDKIVVQSRSDTVEEQTAIARSKNVRQTPKAEKQTRDAPTSTFSLNVSDVSFKMAQAALSNSRVPVQSAIRSEEFVNSFDYGDPAPRGDEPVAFNWEIAKHPYAHGRHIVRFSLETQAAGRSASQPLNINLLVDNSGSMQRPDRRAILEKSLESLGEKLTEQDQLNVILFARQPKLIANASTVASQQIAIHDTLAYKPEGGTNLEAALDAAYANAHANYNPEASNRLILMTDGAANLGDVDPTALAAKVIEQRKQGIALDAYGIGWEDYNDALLEEITRNGDGRYAFLNSVEDASKDFSEKLAGSLRVAAADVKVQIIWNTERVTAYRQVGYDLHQLKKEDFRDNTVDAAEIGEAEAGTALYVLKINEDPDLVEPLGTLSVRYRVPATGKYLERSWPLNMPRSIPGLESASPALKLAASSAFFAERLAENPYARDYSLSDLFALTADLPEAFPTQPRVVELQNMINSARILLGDTK